MVENIVKIKTDENMEGEMYEIMQEVAQTTAVANELRGTLSVMSRQLSDVGEVRIAEDGGVQVEIVEDDEVRVMIVVVKEIGQEVEALV